MISQLTVFLANEKGRLAAATQTLSDNNINMKALFVADTQDFGIVRIFCDTPLKAAELLTEAGFRATITPVIAVKVQNEPGAFAHLLNFCNDASLNIEYGYCFLKSDDVAINVLRIEGENTEELLTQGGFDVLSPEEVYVVD
jgi:hypothetical protein